MIGVDQGGTWGLLVRTWRIVVGGRQVFGGDDGFAF